MNDLTEKQVTRMRKLEVDYEDGQPKCKHCVHKGTKDATMWCQINKFKITKAGICNLWRNHVGETLE